MATYRKIKDLTSLDPKEQKRKETRKRIWWIVAVVLLAVTVFGAYWATHPLLFVKKQTITVEVQHSDDYVEKFTVDTKKNSLVEALADEEIATTDVGKDGVYIRVAGKIKETVYPDYDGTCWDLYIDGELVDEDVSQLPVRDGATYKLVYSKK